MTVRGVRGATTIVEDEPDHIFQATRLLAEEMASVNNFHPADIVSVIVSTTPDIVSAFPAKAVRTIEGWTYVPVICTHEMAVPGALPRCIRILMHVNLATPQQEIHHVYHNDAVQLRPDLQNFNE